MCVIQKTCMRCQQPAMAMHKRSVCCSMAEASLPSATSSHVLISISISDIMHCKVHDVACHGKLPERSTVTCWSLCCGACLVKQPSTSHSSSACRLTVGTNCNLLQHINTNVLNARHCLGCMPDPDAECTMSSKASATKGLPTAVFCHCCCCYCCWRSVRLGHMAVHLHSTAQHST